MDPLWKHPFTCIVAGPTGCGKTTFVTRLLRNASTMIDPSTEHVGVDGHTAVFKIVHDVLSVVILRVLADRHHSLE